MSTFAHVTNLIILWAAPGQVLFVLAYGLLAPWYETAIGRALMTKSTGLAAILGLAFVNYFFGTTWAARDPVRFVVYSLIACGVYYQLAVFARTQWNARRARKEADQ